MTDYKTEFGSLANYNKGGVQLINDDPKNYVFSNIFEVANNAAPFERIAVAKNFEYVVEVMRVEGGSPWFAAPHGEFALCMDGHVDVHLVKMGRIKTGRGHMALLPVGAAYRFHSDQPAVIMIQTIEGPSTQEKWNEICQTA